MFQDLEKLTFHSQGIMIMAKTYYDGILEHIIIKDIA